jgi:hypothetical protein
MRVIKLPGHMYGGFGSVLSRTGVWHELKQEQQDKQDKH